MSDFLNGSRFRKGSLILSALALVTAASAQIDFNNPTVDIAVTQAQLETASGVSAGDYDPSGPSSVGIHVAADTDGTLIFNTDAAGGTGALTDIDPDNPAIFTIIADEATTSLDVNEVAGRP